MVLSHVGETVSQGAAARQGSITLLPRRHAGGIVA
jgi:hypothetical protein